MTDTIEWIRPSGSTITTKNTPEMIEHAAKNGWKQEEKAKPKAKKVKKSDDNSKADS